MAALTVGCSFLMRGDDTTSVITILHAGNTCTIDDNGTASGTCGTITGDVNSANGTITVAGTIGDWSIDFVSGTTYSPSDSPVGLDLGALTATCSGGDCASDNLKIEYSDTDFDDPTPTFLAQLTATINGVGTVEQDAFYGPANSINGKSGTVCNLGPYSVSSLGSCNGGGPVTGSPAYSLTLEDIFTDTGNTGSLVTLSVDGSISAVPEPGALVLFGTVLALCGTKLRRKLS